MSDLHFPRGTRHKSFVVEPRVQAVVSVIPVKYNFESEQLNSDMRIRMVFFTMFHLLGRESVRSIRAALLRVFD